MTASALKRSTSCPAPRAPAPSTTSAEQTARPRPARRRRRPRGVIRRTEVAQERRTAARHARAPTTRAAREGRRGAAGAEQRPDQPADPVERRRPLERAGQAGEGAELEELGRVVGVDEGPDQQGPRAWSRTARRSSATPRMRCPSPIDHGGDRRRRRGRAGRRWRRRLPGGEVVGDQEDGQRQRRPRPMSARVARRDRG